MSSPETKAYEEKVSAQLHEVKAQLGEFESRAKARAAQNEIDAIKRLKSKHDEIDQRRQQLKTVGDAKFGQVKSEIDADVAKLRTSLTDLASKLKKAG